LNNIHVDFNIIKSRKKTILLSYMATNDTRRPLVKVVLESRDCARLRAY